MTKKDLIRLLIKVMGVFVLFNTLPVFVGQFALFGQMGEWLMILWMVFILILTIALASWLIFYPDSIINFFKLDKGFDDDEVKTDQLKSERFIGIAVLIIGGMFILHSIAPFFVEIGQRIYASVSENNPFLPIFETSDNTRLYTNAVELCIGYLLITNYSKVSGFLVSKNKDLKEN